ncbi:PREDICTED: uncharacterized protein LOC105360275 [Ceratosolen solmsi marchali]|uniref:Uncharacterized protein LOC105360275 n=1 Tax=Ceratosolen solmsi marchali TaxID=326594 RepID=A0AAJ6VLH9_9HYME|nr:PREDICTED: uncharacterized protein LOC105360275 [Ceratosolen solmsi marchali]
MSSFLNNDSCAKSKVLDLMKIYSLQNYEKCKNEQRDEVEFKSTNKIDKIYSVRDLKEIENFETTRQNETIINKNLSDCTIRNKSWELASDVCDWSSSPIGILPWQINDIQAMEASTISPSDVQYVIVKNLELPKIINSKKLILHSKIHWERLLEKKKAKRKVKTNKIVTSTIVNRAMKNVNNNNKQNVK